ncbi:MAG: aldo/keto reductase [Chloroflexi bacterium]|nr:aldo/keto reductase [Chloroflexota bacterium]
MAEIKKRRLGKTGLMVTELGLGAMDTPTVPEGEQALHTALDLGINYIDTARIYQASEYLIGEVIRARGGRSFYLASKTINRSANGAQYDVDRSLSLLGVDAIDVYQVDDVLPEDWDKVMSEEGALAGLQVAKMRGLIGHIGITSHSLEVLEKAIACGEFETVMMEYSAFYHETEGLIAKAKERDIGVVVMRPLGGSGRTSSIRTRMAAGERVLTPAMLLRYVLSNPCISVAIPGVRYPDRVRQNVETAETYRPLTEALKRQWEVEAEAARFA